MNAERRSRNRIVLVVVLVLVIEPRHPIEDEDEEEEEKFARRAKILRDSSTNENKWSVSEFVFIRVHSWSNCFGCGEAALRFHASRATHHAPDFTAKLVRDWLASNVLDR